MRWGSTRLSLLLFFLVAGCSSPAATVPAPDASHVVVDAAGGEVGSASDASELDTHQAALCAADSDCSEAGATCTCKGACEVFSSNPCLTDKNCPGDDYCDSCAGFCRPTVALCGACETDDACENDGACLPFASGGSFCAIPCVTKAGCGGPGYECVAVSPYPSNLCVPATGSCDDLGLCESDGECPDGEMCSDHLKICVEGCAEDGECAGDLICAAARCIEACLTDADCSGLAECDAGHCKVPGACESADDCFQPETYCDKSLGECVAGCLVDADCQDAALQCANKACVPKGCVHNYQCAFEEVCDKSVGACVPTTDAHCEGCTAGEEAACGGDPNLCLTFQDEDPATGETVEKGDFCVLPCADDPVDQCPQGYGCTHIEAEGVDGFYCVRSCWITPVGSTP